MLFRVLNKKDKRYANLSFLVILILSRKSYRTVFKLFCLNGCHISKKGDQANVKIDRYQNNALFQKIVFFSRLNLTQTHLL